MKKLLTLLVMIFICRISPAAATGFIEGMEDIPLPEQTIQIQGNNLSFGNEETRLVEAYLKSSSLKYSAVKKFYKETLPQLGWKIISETDTVLTFGRNQEELDIVTESKMPLIMRVTLTGRP